MTKVHGVWTVAIVHEILSNKNSCYLGCSSKDCCKKVNKKGRGYKCPMCPGVISVGVYRYMLRITFKHGHSTATFLMRDKECFNIIHKAAGALRDNMTKDSVAMGCPKETMELVGKQYLFRVDFKADQSSQNNEKLFSVNRVSEYRGLLKLHASGEPSNLEDTDSDVERDLQSLFEKPIAVYSNTVDLVEDEDDGVHLTTPLKRLRANDDDGSGNGSSVQNSVSKTCRVVKTEKP